MREGFIYDKDKCVNCKACSAACILANGWNISAREIFSYNAGAEPLIPLINLSLACNHCESAVCMTGCPSSAYRRDENSSAIILDADKCIGCRYCQWSCPYEAPKFDNTCNTIVKCSLCYSEGTTGIQPACVVACPTGALKFGELTDVQTGEIFSWFPDKMLNPAISFNNNQNYKPLTIIPENNSPNAYVQEQERKNISSESSLLIFSFLSTLLVSVVAISFIKGVFPNASVFCFFLIVTGFISLFHLGKKKRFWRAVTNIRKSPLSREIAAYIVFSVTSIGAIILQRPLLMIASAVIGFVFLLLIDGVYVFPDRRKRVFLHSGQTFLSALIIISFFSGEIQPFIFMAVVKLVLFLRSYFDRPSEQFFIIRFLRFAFLIVSGSALLIHSSMPDYFVIFVFLMGELFDRILFYLDFNPLNIRKLLSEQLNIEKNEKERG